MTIPEDVNVVERLSVSLSQPKPLRRSSSLKKKNTSLKTKKSSKTPPTATTTKTTTKKTTKKKSQIEKFQERQDESDRLDRIKNGEPEPALKKPALETEYSTEQTPNNPQKNKRRKRSSSGEQHRK